MKGFDKIKKLEKSLRDKPLSPEEETELLKLKEETVGMVVCVNYGGNYKPTRRDELEFLRVAIAIKKYRRRAQKIGKESCPSKTQLL